MALAQAVGRGDDPVVRQGIVRVHTLRTGERVERRCAPRPQLAQGTSSPIMSLGKLAMSRHPAHRRAPCRPTSSAPRRCSTGRTTRAADAANFLALNAYFTSIGGGTDQIQRNIIGERVLGLPSEPEPDRDMAFKDVRKATVRGEAIMSVDYAERFPSLAFDRPTETVLRITLDAPGLNAVSPDVHRELADVWLGDRPRPRRRASPSARAPARRSRPAAASS